VEVVASLSQGRTAAAQCSLFTYKSVAVIFEPPCTYVFIEVTQWEVVDLSHLVFFCNCDRHRIFTIGLLWLSSPPPLHYAGNSVVTVLYTNLVMAAVGMEPWKHF